MAAVRQYDDTVVSIRQREREARQLGALNDLLGRRPDLRGVYAPADAAADASLWCV